MEGNIEELLDAEYEATLEEAKIRAEEDKIQHREEYEREYKYLWRKFDEAVPITDKISILIRKDRSYDRVSAEPTIYELYAIERFAKELAKEGYTATHREKIKRWADAYRTPFFEAQYVVEIKR